MKWFESGLSVEELKRVYRKLSREYHPDMHATDDEEEQARCEACFKEINEEYAHYYTNILLPRDQYLAKQDRIFKQLEIARQLQREIYPKTVVSYIAYFEHALIEFTQNTPMKKMLEIIDLAQQSVTFPIKVSFTRPVRKKPFEMLYNGDVYIDTDMESTQTLQWKEVPTTYRRYKLYHAPKFDCVHDTKLDINYYMRHSNKVDLLEDIVK